MQLAQGIAVVLAYTLIDPLTEDIQDTFGKSLFYHPASLWIVIILLVYTQTASLTTGITVVLLYELLKFIWRGISPEPSTVGQTRKLIHRLQNKTPLSDSDVLFLNKITPDNIVVTQK